MWPLKPKVDPEAGVAIDDAKKSLERVKAQQSEVKAITGRLRSIRERNHFAEKLEPIMFPRR